MATKTAKIFASGRSQAVRLPAEFRFDGLFELYGKDQVGDDFLGPADRKQPSQDRDPFEGWKE
jgi:antitoxin VapB